LFLGDEDSATNEEVITNFGITHVVSALPPGPQAKKFAELGVRYCECPILDSPYSRIEEYFTDANEFIETAKNQNGKVLCHCAAGVSRSATLVLSYLMHSMRWPLKQALVYVKQRRPVIFPNEGFLRKLITSETALFGQPSISLSEIETLLTAD